MIKTILSFAAAILSAVYSIAAMAADPFTVSGVPVDATGATAIEAQTMAMSEGQAIAAQVLINRLTLKSERDSKPAAPLETETIARMIRALEVANEKRSASRYLGDITVAFNPAQVQATLHDLGLNMISTQSRERLVLPVLGGQNLWTPNAWSAAMQNGAFAHSLTPLRTAKMGDGAERLIDNVGVRSGNMDALRAIGARYGLSQVLIAEATPGAAGIRVSLTDIALDTGQARGLGTVTGADYNLASWAVIEALESDWKQASVSLAENAENMVVSVLYRSHAEWLQLQEAINGSAQIQGARLDALSKDGALMTLTYGGDIERLRNELAFKGVRLERDPELGVVLSRSGRF